MITNSNHIKSSFLEIPYGTACSKLRKLLLFRMSQGLGLDSCFRCGRKILSESDFSIDHKKEWLHEDPELFWDLDNIAFSHLSCNIGASRIPHRIGCPEGQSWCSKCQESLPVEDFYKQSPGIQAGRTGTKNGLRKTCKNCCNRMRVEGRRRKRAVG